MARLPMGPLGQVSYKLMFALVRVEKFPKI